MVEPQSNQYLALEAAKPRTPEEKPPKAPKWQRYGNLAQWISALAAVIALIFIVVQLSTLTTNARQTSARQIYISYMDASYKNPQFLSPDYNAIRKDPQQLAYYKLYVSHALWSYDEILESTTENWLERQGRRLKKTLGIKVDTDDGWVSAFKLDMLPIFDFCASSLTTNS